MTDRDQDDRPPGSVFEADWLTLREAVDHRSRAVELMEPLRQEWRTRGWNRIVDLGSGTGSNVRYLAPRLPGPQSWTLVDHDAALLRQAGFPAEAGAPVLVTGDLAREGLSALAGADLCAATALLDLVSQTWLDQVVEACVGGARGALFTLTYDGTVAWEGSASPEDDAFILELLNSHQERDKGLGGALGPRAAFEARASFERAGYRTWLVPSPWRLAASDRAVVGRLVEGWEEAAREESPGDTRRITRWAELKYGEAAGASFALTVGHLDLLALPPEVDGME
jgi:SAM-dependent methyltransferase